MESELFSEIYNCYFLVVRRILDEAAEHGLSESDLNHIACLLYTSPSPRDS